MNPFVSVVIVNLNGSDVLQSCLRSVFSQHYSPFEVILVDNGSSDGSEVSAAREFPDVIVIRNTTNKGFAEGNNIGVGAAKGGLVILLNNDTVVEEGWLKGLVDAIEPPSVAVASSLVLTEGVPRRYYDKNGSINFLGHNIMMKFERPENIFYAGGASLIFRKDIFRLPFDTDYFAYGEDVYLSLRARRMGYHIRHANQSVVHHRGGVTTKSQKGSFIEMLRERNRLLNTFLFFSSVTILRVSPLIVLSAAVKTGLSCVSRRYFLFGILRAYAWLITHPVTIVRKRHALRKAFTIPESEVISWMTADITNGESAPGRVANYFMRWYFRLVGIRTLESLPPGVR